MATVTGAGGTAAHAARSLLAWAAASGDPAGTAPRTAVVTGPSGAGKSRLLARFVAGTAGEADPAAGGTGASASRTAARPTVHAVGLAEGQIARTLSWQLGRHLGYGPVGPDELLRRLAADPRPVLMVVTDLHRSGRGPSDLPAARPAALVDGLIAPLRSLPNVRLIVECDTPRLLGTEDGLLVVPLEPAADGPPAPETHPAGATAPPAPGHDWRSATPDERERALDHALATGSAHELLRDPGYLVYGSVPAVTAVLGDQRVPVPPGLREIWATAAPALSAPDLPDTQRAAVLHAAALAAHPRLAEFLRPLAESGPWVTHWSHASRPTAALALTGPATGAFVAADALGRLTRYALADGQALTSLPSGTAWQPAALAPVTSDGLLALDRSGVLRPLLLGPDALLPIGSGSLLLHHNAAVLAPEPDPADLPTALAATTRHAAVGDGLGRVHLWPLDSPAPEPRTTLRPHRAAVTAVACLDLGDTLLVASGGLDGTVTLGDSATARPLTEPVERRDALPTALALADTDAAGPVLAVAWSDQRLHLWHLLSGRRAALPAPYGLRSLALTGDGRLLSAGTRGTRLTRLDLAALWAGTAGRRAG
jgi:hypothetical protein